MIIRKIQNNIRAHHRRLNTHEYVRKNKTLSLMSCYERIGEKIRAQRRDKVLVSSSRTMDFKRYESRNAFRTA
jgi:hypothetical protein